MHAPNTSFTGAHPIYEAYNLGWSVAAVAPRNKKAIVKWAEYQTRRPAHKTIDDWFRHWPDMNYAVITGRLSGVIVMDVDGGLGFISVSELGILPKTVSVQTPKGRHYYFKHPGGTVKTDSGVLPGVDSRGDGGYVVGPGSLLENNDLIKQVEGSYEWLVHPSEAELADAPDWWLRLVVKGGPGQAGAQEQPTPPPGKHLRVVGGQEASQSRYAERALEMELDILRSSREGLRNHTLNNAAFAMGTLVAAGLLDEHHVEDELRRVAEAIGLDPSEIGPTIRSGMRAGMRHPRHVPDRPEPPRFSHVEPPQQDRVPQPNVDETKMLQEAHLTDAGNAECFALLYSTMFRYCHTRGKWLHWDGIRWSLDGDGEASRCALDTVRKRQHAVLDMEDYDKRKKALSYLFSSENTAKRRGLLDTAGILDEFTTEIDRYDRNDWLAATPSGTLDLKNGTMKEPDRNDLITKTLGTHFDQEAKAPRWKQFLEEVFAGDAELIQYIQRAVGYSLTGDTSEQKLFLCFGDGMNGKSKFLEVLSLLLGDYAANTPFNTFDADNHDSLRNDLAGLKGARFVTVIETDEDRRLSEARVKAVTGQDAISCRFLHKEFFTYRPTWKLWLAMNHLPIIRGTDNGIWRRIKLIPFTQNFEGREDKDLIDKLRAELPGILNWALYGLGQWHQHGLGTAQSVEDASKEYRTSSDMVGQWLDDCTERSAAFSTPCSEAFASYSKWCEQQGLKFHRAPTAINLGKALKEKHFLTDRDMKKRYYVGFRLIDPVINIRDND